MLIFEGMLIGLGRLDVGEPFADVAFGEAVVRTELGDVRVIGLSPEQCQGLAPRMYKGVAITITAGVD